MCNLYDVGPAPRKRRFAWEKDLAALLDGLTYVAPGKPGLIAFDTGDVISTSRAVWGFQRKFPGKGGMVARDVNNARDDKLEGRMWGKAFRERRCVIPVRRFFEWSGSKPRIGTLRRQRKANWNFPPQIPSRKQLSISHKMNLQVIALE